jgi:hypothetical protein
VKKSRTSLSEGALVLVLRYSQRPIDLINF